MFDVRYSLFVIPCPTEVIQAGIFDIRYFRRIFNNDRNIYILYVVLRLTSNPS